MGEREKKIDELADALERMWSGGGGDYGVYTVYNEKVKVRRLLHELLAAPLPSEKEDQNG